MKRRLKTCLKVGCNQLTRESYCVKHSIDSNKEKEKRKKEYNKQYNLKREEQYTTFYKSKAWKGLRILALQRDNYLCVECLKNNIVTPCDVVDHIVEVRDDWEKRLDINNLQSLCHFHHNIKTKREMHKRKK